MQFNKWSEIYKHYSTWLAIALIVFNAILTMTTGIPIEWVANINTFIGIAIIVAKKVKQTLDTANVVITSVEETGEVPDPDKDKAA